MQLPQSKTGSLIIHIYIYIYIYPGSNIPQNSDCMAANLPFLKPSNLHGQDIRDTAEEVRTSLKEIISYGPLHTDVQVLGDQLELIYNSSVQTQDCSLDDMPEEMDDRDEWQEG